MGIPAEFLRPILPSSRHLPHAVIESEPDGYPRLGKSLAIIDCDLPESIIQARYPEFWKYLESGKAQGVDSGYLASRRTPWYSQEKRDPAPFLCTYMGREKSDGNPFRFFWNKSRATAANVYLLLYPRGDLEAALAARPDLYPIVFTHLLSLTGEHLIKEGRVYGGGLHKMEPKELANLPADALTKIIQVRPTPKQRS
jgi:adenine-specific DNA-methyltransferase